MSLAHGPVNRGHCRVCISVGEASSNDPLLFKRFVDLHIDRESLEGFTIADLIALPLYLALSFQFLKAVGAESNLVQGQNLRHHLHFDGSRLV